MQKGMSWVCLVAAFGLFFLGLTFGRREPNGPLLFIAGAIALLGAAVASRQPGK